LERLKSLDKWLLIVKIEIDKKREEIKPVALYEEIVFNFPVKELVNPYNRRELKEFK